MAYTIRHICACNKACIHIIYLSTHVLGIPCICTCSYTHTQCLHSFVHAYIQSTYAPALQKYNTFGRIYSQGPFCLSTIFQKHASNCSQPTELFAHRTQLLRVLDIYVTMCDVQKGLKQHVISLCWLCRGDTPQTHIRLPCMQAPCFPGLSGLRKTETGY